jgi:alpha-L-fucosidase
VSKNGNLLLNVGPMADGTIPEVQVNLLKGLGAWLRAYGEAVYGTRPWRRAQGVTAQRMEVRFTQKGDSLYAFILGRPGEKNVLIKDVPLEGNIRVYEVKSGTPLEFRQEGADLVLNYPQGLLEESVQVVGIRSG